MQNAATLSLVAIKTLGKTIISVLVFVVFGAGFELTLAPRPL